MLDYRSVQPLTPCLDLYCVMSNSLHISCTARANTNASMFFFQGLGVEMSEIERNIRVPFKKCVAVPDESDCLNRWFRILSESDLLLLIVLRASLFEEQWLQSRYPQPRVDDHHCWWNFLFGKTGKALEANNAHTIHIHLSYRQRVSRKWAVSDTHAPHARIFRVSCTYKAGMLLYADISSKGQEPWQFTDKNQATQLIWWILPYSLFHPVFIHNSKVIHLNLKKKPHPNHLYQSRQKRTRSYLHQAACSQRCPGMSFWNISLLQDKDQCLIYVPLKHPPNMLMFYHFKALGCLLILDR